MSAEEYIKVINDEIGQDTAHVSDKESSPTSLIISQEKILEVATLLHTSETFLFDLLECITGLDNGPESGKLELIYHLYSIPFDRKLALRVIMSRDEPSIESVSGIWRTANWLEREVFDLLGIHFKNHPDLRRILMPNDWIGFPLRKDYKTDTTYHGIKIDF